MTIFNFTNEQLESLSSKYTVTEIHQQPLTWEKTFNQIKELKSEIKKFISNVISENDYDVVFTGAGTSEFVGNALFSYINMLTGYRAHSYASTDITASPENYISSVKKTLLVSFGRSGNSPESIGAVNSANAVSDKVYHLFITCNKDGELSKRALKEERCYAINLTPETHDLSFAMTSSFTNMYIAAYLIFNLDNLDDAINGLEKIVEKTNIIVNENFNFFKNIVEEYNFNRIVYLGSNSLKGIAQESALKMLELTAGKVVTMYDTPLGFRHGPKSIIDDNTLTVVYLSDNEYTRKYEIDLIKEMGPQRKGNKILVVTNKANDEAKEIADYYYELNSSDKNNVELGAAYIVCAQLIALYKSLSLNITPDNPCPTGEVNRVVKGVTLYKYTK